MFPRSTLNDIRERISIVSFVGERVPLKKAGRNYKGLCPFHNEKTSSFMVSDEKGIFHCFGCGEGGDIFKFVMKFDGLSFAEAVEHLARRAGVELPKSSPALVAAEEEGARKRRLLLRLNELARDFFTSRLLEEKVGAKARNYLQHRGISRENWTQHFLGYAEDSWDSLAFHLKEKGVSLKLAAEVGLVKEREGGGFYDFFRDRVIFPIISARGEVLGFGGREIGGGGDGAKYLNSPDSFVYHKSNCVYGLDRSQGAIRNEDQAIMVEGYMDFIALHQAQIGNVVAPLGTALTPGHLRLISRYTRNLTLVFDGDEAGSRAAMRSLEVSIDAGFSPRVVALPEGEDPDSLVRKEGREPFLKRVKLAQPLFEYFVERTIALTGADAVGRVAAIGKIVPLLGAVCDPAERGIYRRYVARRLDIDEQSIEYAIAERLRKPLAAMKDARGKATEAAGIKDQAIIRSAERTLVELMLVMPDAADVVFSRLEPSSFEEEWVKVVALSIYEIWKRDGSLKPAVLFDEMDDEELASELRQLSLGSGQWSEKEGQEMLHDCIAQIEKRPLVTRMERINEDIQRAEATGDNARLMSLIAEKKELAARVMGGSRGN